MKKIKGGVTAAKGLKQRPQQRELNIREEPIWLWYTAKSPVRQQVLLLQMW